MPTESTERPARPKVLAPLALSLLALALAAGCAMTQVSDSQQLVTGPLPRPGHIWVYNFVATASDVPTDSRLAGEPNVDTSPQAQTPDQIARGRRLGAEIANQLAAQIRGMGLPGALASASTRPQINDIVIRGYLLSVKQGDAAQRVIIGFGSGASEMRTLVEGFQVTAKGQRELGSGTIDANGSTSPGAALGLATFLATANPAGLILSSATHVHAEETGSSTVQGRAQATATELAGLLKTRFQQQGWIPPSPAPSL